MTDRTRYCALRRLPTRHSLVVRGIEMPLFTLLRMLCLVMMALLTSSQANARVIYVRSSGSDSLDGSSPTKAVRTIGRGSSLARAGDDVVVGRGTYREGNLSPSVFGHVRFLADRRGIYTGDPPGHVVVDATGFGVAFEANGQLGITIDGFVIYGGSIGIYVKSESHQAVVSNNVVSNCTSNGIYVQDSRSAVVFNNLVYNNTQTGILVTGNADGSAGAVVLNNTVYLNGNRGIFFSGTDIGSPNGLVLNNVVQANANAGIQINTSSRDGYLSAGNVSFDNRFASGTPIDVTDITADPAFVSPAGQDGILGGAGFADDSFHLSDRSAGQMVSSPAINVGSDVARRLALYRSSTRTDGGNDRGYVDAGYHYNNFTAPPASPQARIRLRRLYVSLDKGVDTNDGTTRSTPVGSLERALDLARPGNQIRLHSGTYREGETIITAAKSGKPGRPLVIKGLGNVVLDAGGAQRGLTLTGVSDLVIEGIGVTGALDNGVEVRNSSAANPSDARSYSATLRGCRLFGNGKRGLSVRNSSAVRVETCRIEDNGDRGVQLEASAASFDQCAIHDNGSTGLWAFDGSTVAARHTDFIDNPQDGVLVDGSNLSLQGGRLSGSKDGGARFRARSTGLLEGVVVEGNQDLGVQVFSSSLRLVNALVRNNRIGLFAANDAGLNVASEVVIEGSMLSHSVASGADVQNTSLILRNSALVANGSDGLQQEGGTAAITSSAFDGNDSVGISLRNVSATIVDAQARSNDSDGIQAAASRVTIEGSQVEGNGRSGLWASEASQVNIERSDFVDNVSQSLLVQGSELTLYGGTLRGSKEGGARFLSGSSGELQNVIITDNEDAGVLVLSSRLDVVGATIQRNRVGIFGALLPMLALPNELSVEDSMICDNTASGIEIQDTRLSLEQSLLCSNQSDGLRQKGGSANVQGCAFGDNGARGISVADAGSVLLDTVVAARNASNGLQVTNSGSVDLTNADVFENAGEGFTAQSSAVETIANSRFYKNAASGIVVLENNPGTGALQMRECSAHDNGQEGLRITGGGVAITDGTFEDNLARGISIGDASQVTLRDIVAARNANHGVQILGSQQVDLSGADIFDNGRDGVTAQGSTVQSIADTQVFENGDSGIVLLGNDPMGSLRVTDTSSHRNRQEGLRLTGGSLRLERCSFEENEADGVSLATMEAVAAQDIQVLRNGSNGFEVSTANSFDLSHSVLGDNGGDGLTLVDVAGSAVSNALVFQNASTGILIAGRNILAPAARLVGSTVFGNINRGLLVDGDLASPSSVKVEILRNIFRNNGNAGIQVNTAPFVDYLGDYNLSTDPYGAQTPVGTHDILRDPLFVDAASMNFHLSQVSAGQATTSPAVDAGSISAAAAGMAQYTTRTDGVPDSGITDIGYHYPPPTPAP